ncbi:MAG: hypothetical protein JXR95_12340 [Deltaproteobacteria bacterium]|nr:hypothetical protein [Deltaproteobacteria bacterium]
MKLATFFLSLILLFSSSSFAETFKTVNTNALKMTPLQRSEYFFENESSVIGWEKFSFRHLKTIKLRHTTVVKFVQTYENMDISGKTVSLEIDSDGRVIRIWGTPSLKIPDTSKPVSSPLSAIYAIEDMLDTILPPNTTAQLTVLDRGNPLVVYRVAAWDGLKRYHFYVDATSSQIIRKISTQTSALGRVFLLDPSTGDATDVELLNTIDGTELGGHGALFSVYNCVTAPESGMMGGPDIENMEVEPVTAVEGTSDYLYDPLIDVVDYTEFAGAVNLYYHVDRMATRFEELGYTTTTPLSIIANVHSEDTGGTKIPYDNAFYTPTSDGNDMITAGQGTEIDLAYGGDVIMHEFTHSVIAHTSIGLETPQFDEYGIARMPLGIHEGLADYFPSSLNDTPVMGAWALESIEAGASRDLSNNNKSCPEDLWGEEHMDGELIGAFSWHIRTVLGSEKADNVLFETLVRLPNAPTFKDFYDSAIITIDEWIADGEVAEEDKTSIVQVGQEKGLDICGRDIPLDGDYSVNSFGLDMLGAYMGADCATVRNYVGPQGVAIPTMFQYRLDIPEDVTELTVTPIFSSLESGNDFQWNIYAKTGSMVEYEMVSLFGGLELPRISNYDKVWPETGANTTSSESFTWSIADDPALPSGSTVYFAVTNMNCPMTTLTIDYTTSTDPIENPDAGVDAETDAEIDSGTEEKPSSKDGCSCSAGHSSENSSSTFFMIFMGLALAFVFRKSL